MHVCAHHEKIVDEPNFQKKGIVALWKRTRITKMKGKSYDPYKAKKIGQAKRPGPVPKVPREFIPAQVAATCARLFVPKDE